MRYYRRNTDEDLRNLERNYASSGSLEDLEKLNAARTRIGIPLIKLLPNLEWGYGPGMPPGSTAAWGARMILEHGSASLLHDRTDVVSTNPEDRAALISVLNGIPPGTGAIQKAQDEIARLLRAGRLSPSDAEEFTLYRDSSVTVVGNSNASHGYFYIVGFLNPKWGWNVPEFKRCEKCNAEREDNLLTECITCHLKVCVDSFEPCASRCYYCKAAQCNQHLEYASKCESCEEPLCFSEACRSNRPIAECFSKICERVYCYDCRGELENCPCKDEKWCDSCGEQMEECEDCKEDWCPCDPCSCEKAATCDNCGEQMEECYDCGEDRCECSPCSCYKE